MIDLKYDNEKEAYVNEETGHMLRREEGDTPNGNPLSNRWVLRIKGEFIDFSAYRNDIAEHYDLELGIINFRDGDE